MLCSSCKHSGRTILSPRQIESLRALAVKALEGSPKQLQASRRRSLRPAQHAMPSRGSEEASGAPPEPMQPGSPYSDWRIGLERITLFSDRRHADDAHRHSHQYAPEMAAVAGPGGSSAFLLEPPYSAAAVQQTPTIPQCLSLERSGRMLIEGNRAQPGDQDASTAQQDMVAAAPLPGKRKLDSAPSAEHAAKRPCAEEVQLQNERHQGRVVELGDPCLASRCLHGKRSPAAWDPSEACSTM